MAKIPVKAGGRLWPSKGALTAHVKAILNAGAIGSEVTGQDALVLFDLLAQRPDKLEEIGERKVLGFERRYREGKENWTSCFWILLDDGTAIDFSVYKAITALRPAAE